MGRHKITKLSLSTLWLISVKQEKKATIGQEKERLFES